MPTYRVWQQDGQNQIIQAMRVVSDGTCVCFENQVGQQWKDVLTRADRAGGTCAATGQRAGWVALDPRQAAHGEPTVPPWVTWSSGS